MNEELPEVNLNELITLTLQLFYSKVGSSKLEHEIDARMKALVERVATKVLDDYEARKADKIAERIEQGIIRAFDRIR